MDMISSFAQSPLFSVLGQVDGVCLLRQSNLLEVDGTSACSQCACVRACTISIKAEADPTRSHGKDGTLRAVEFSDHLQILR